MADPYSPYLSTADRGAGSISRPSFPGYLPSEASSSYTSHYASSYTAFPGASTGLLSDNNNSFRPGGYGYGSTPMAGAGLHSEPNLGGVSAAADVRGYSSLYDPLQPGEYGIDSISNHSKPSIAGLSTGATVRGYSPLEDSNLVSHRKDTAAGINPIIPVITNVRPSSVTKVDGSSAVNGQSNILFVDGLPTDCTRREAGHIFRPFVGYKDIKVVHKEPRRSGDRAAVFCFVEFADSKCALTAMDALQGYKFDDKKPEASILRIQFANFPLRLGSDRDEQQDFPR